MASAPTANAEAYRLYLSGAGLHAPAGDPAETSRSPSNSSSRRWRSIPALHLRTRHSLRCTAGCTGGATTTHPSRAARQREEAETALRLAPDLPQAHAVMGMVYYWGERDYPGACRNCKSRSRAYRTTRTMGVGRRPAPPAGPVGRGASQRSRRPPGSTRATRTCTWTRRWYLPDHAPLPRGGTAFDRALILAPDLYAAALQRAGPMCAGRESSTHYVRSSAVSREPRPRGRASGQRIRLRSSSLSVSGQPPAGIGNPPRRLPGAGLPQPASSTPPGRTSSAATTPRARGVRFALLLLDSANAVLPDDYRVHAARASRWPVCRREERSRGTMDPAVGDLSQ